MVGDPLTAADVLTVTVTIPDPPPVQLMVSGCARLIVAMELKLVTVKEAGKPSDALNGPTAADPLLEMVYVPPVSTPLAIADSYNSPLVRDSGANARAGERPGPLTEGDPAFRYESGAERAGAVSAAV